MSFNTSTRKLLYQKMNSGGMGVTATASYNLSKKTKPFAEMKGFPMLLNLSIILHHDGSVLLLDFLLIRFSVFPPILLRNFFGQVWYLRKACTDPSLFLVYTRNDQSISVFQENIIQKKKLGLKTIHVRT